MERKSQTRCGPSSPVRGVVTGLLLGFMVWGTALAQPKEQPGKTPAPPPIQIQVQMFVMSQCPYSADALRQMAALLKAMGNVVAFRLEVIAFQEEGKFVSLHGEPELQGDRILLCAQDQFPESLRFMELADCLMEDPAALPDNLEACTRRLSWSPTEVSQLNACVSGEKGDKLLLDSASQAATWGIDASPMIFINGGLHLGRRTVEAMARPICSVLPPELAPPLCSSLPPVQVVPLTILTDRRCKLASCDIQHITLVLGQVLPGLAVTLLDWSDPRARRLWKELGLKALPAFLFDPVLEKTDAHAELAPFLRPLGKKEKYLSLELGSEFDPTREICDNREDDNGDGQVDCKDPQCTAALLCRPRIQGHLDLFIMSHCPYGILALNALKALDKAFGKGITLKLHYIVTQEEGGGFQSLHGSEEVEEDLRQICAAQVSPEHYLEYIWCRNRDISYGEWKTCAVVATIEPASIEACVASGSAHQRLREDAQLCEALNIAASPTWIAHNNQAFNAISADAVQGTLCDREFSHEGCKVRLEATQTPDGSCL